MSDSELSASTDELGEGFYSGTIVGMPIRCGKYVGRVVAVRARSFDCEFAWDEPMKVQIARLDGGVMWVEQTTWKRRFRKSDGRSMGGREYSWAQRVQPNTN